MINARNRISCITTVSGILVLATISGCTVPSVGPDYRRPETPKTAVFDDVLTVNSAPSQAELAVEWWRSFNDPELDHCIEEALKQNQQLVGALARVEQARALSGEARSNYLPFIGASGSVSRERSSENVSNPFRNTLSTTYRLPLNLTWELDLFGRVRRLNESAHAGLLASREVADATRLAVASEVATCYFALRTTDEESRIVAETLKLQADQLELVIVRRDEGRSDDLAVEQARTAKYLAEAELAAVANRRAALKNGLAVLLGRPAPGYELKATHWHNPTLPTIPVGIPSELLQRRPDLAAAENKLKAANAQIGVAKAAFFPAVSLTSSAGYASADLGELFNGDSRTWGISPSVYLPIFQGGRNRSNYARSQALYEETLAAYHQSVLSALREVQDTLTASQRLAEQSESIGEAVASARKFSELAEVRYLAGATGYLDVIGAQRAALSIERGAVILDGQRLITRIALIRALGGGWKTPSVL